MLSILATLAPSIFGIIDKVIPDQDIALKLKHELSAQMVDSKSEIARSAADVVMSEAKGESWLQRNWRPLLMIWFSILIGGYWFGFVPVNMPIEIVEKLFTLVQIGVGGYVGGRTLEKVSKTIAPTLRDRL